MKRMSHGMRVLTYGVALVVVTTVSSVLGQPADDGGGRGLQGRRRDRGAWVARMVERVAQELNLDDEQNAQLNTIVAEQRERMREVRRLFRALREAEDSGDAERAEELRAQLPERPEHGWDPVRPVLDRLEPFLRPDQLDGLEALRNRPRGPRARLERLAEDLNLDAQQRVQFDEFAEAMGARFSDQRGRWRELRPLFRELREARDTGDAELVETLTAQISELRPARGTAMNEFFDNVEGILREDQIPVLQQIRSRR
ncbi:MAG: Spy/CpxP family protein refolding chaperone, partial [Phycisphaerae bacterium]